MRKRGFTLIELLVSMLLLTVVLGAVYRTYFLSQKALDGLDESLQKYHECRMTIDLIRREVEAGLFVQGNSRSAFRIEDRDLFGKQASRITFTAFSPLIPGLSAISYYVEEHKGKLMLMKTMQAAYNTSSEAKGVEIIEGIEGFSLEVKEGDKTLRTWDAKETGRMPAELKVTILVTVKDKPLIFTETIQPKLGGRI